MTITESIEKAMKIGVVPNERGGQIFADEALALYEAICRAPARLPVIELGCYRGRSTVILATAARDLESPLISIDNFKYQKFGASCPDCVSRNVTYIWKHFTVHKQDTTIVPKNLREIGALFIDSDHRDEHINKELDAWLPLMAHKAILAVHDYRNPNWLTLPALLDARLKGWKKIAEVSSVAAFQKP